MASRVTIIGAVLFVLVVVALLISFIPGTRLKANIVGSQNNLRELAIFAAHHVKPDAQRDPSKLPTEIPAGTLFLEGEPPDNRLSWVVGVLPGMDQRKQNTAELITQIDTTKPWKAEANQKAGGTRLVVLLCPENTPEVQPGQPAITCYVGIGGVGADAASLPRFDPEAGAIESLLPRAGGATRAGAFRYDSPTPFSFVTDGLSQTLLFAETRDEVGPWLRGGVSTTRGLVNSSTAIPLIGGQFGGYFPEVAHFALCDGSVRPFTSRTTPQVLFAMATIAGKEGEMPVE